MSFIVGLTGGIGSGKTLASDHFASLGVPIIDTDVIAREVVSGPNSPVLNELVTYFGTDILSNSGELDRNRLRERAFTSSERKTTLDSITHPAIFKATTDKLQSVNHTYSIVVIPLLSPQSPFFSLLDRTLTVNADTETRIARVMKRNQLARDKVEQIMQTQLTDEQRSSFADDVIENNTHIAHVQERVQTLHQQYLSLALSPQLKKTDH